MISARSGCHNAVWVEGGRMRANVARLARMLNVGVGIGSSGRELAFGSERGRLREERAQLEATAPSQRLQR